VCNGLVWFNVTKLKAKPLCELFVLIVINNKNLTTLTQNDSKLKAFEGKNDGMMKNDEKKNYYKFQSPFNLVIFFHCIMVWNFPYHLQMFLIWKI
jgi:hypothetical protein